MSKLTSLMTEIAACKICADRFAKTATQHAPRPVAWLSEAAPILIIGQAPGARVHESGRPFSDPSGDRLRAWLGVTEEKFYNRSSFAISPMAYCFPGYSAGGSDLPPPKICADTWAASALTAMPKVRLTLMIGGYAQKYHLKTKNVTDTVRDWQRFGPSIIPLPHPSWRNTAWLRKNPWFEADLLPVLRTRVKELVG